MLIYGRYIVVGRGHCLFGTKYADPATINSRKGLWTGYFMYQVPVNIEYRGTPFDLFHNMLIPDLVK